VAQAEDSAFFIAFVILLEACSLYLFGLIGAEDLHFHLIAFLLNSAPHYAMSGQRKKVTEQQTRHVDQVAVLLHRL
jgi:hypothetical protein